METVVDHCPLARHSRDGVPVYPATQVPEATVFDNVFAGQLAFE